MESNIDLKELTAKEVVETYGGVVQFITGIVVGWVVSEIVQGIYQADKNGCI